METQQVLENHLCNLKVLTPEEIQVIQEATIVRKYKKGEMLLKEGQTQTECYMILVGCIREYIIDNGGDKTTAFYTEGDKITSYSSEGKNIASKHYLECVEDCIITVSSQNFEDELRKLVPRMDAIIQQIAKEQLGKNKDEFTTYVASSPEERYQKLLDTKPTLFNRVPQYQIASFLGVKPESLSRIRKRIHTKLKTNTDPAQ